jgi:hypothetical protein
VVGLYLDPPAHAIVLSVDEKSQIQALDRTQRECLIFCVSDLVHAVLRYAQVSKRPANIMAS